MKFDKARNLVKFLLAMCVVFCVVGIVTNGSGLGGLSLLFSMLFFVLSVVVILAYCKCPHCGKRIYLGLFRISDCPKCRHNLITGEKSKGKKR